MRILTRTWRGPLGMGPEARRAIVPLAARRALIEERTGAKASIRPDFQAKSQRWTTLRRRNRRASAIFTFWFLARWKPAARCGLSESVMLRALMADVVLYKDERDHRLEAGWSTWGERRRAAVDLMITVVEPGARAVETAASVRRMAGEIGLTRHAVIGTKDNKLRDEAFLAGAFPGRITWGGCRANETIPARDRECLP